jgi:ubiquinone/menaquinone biosynthesis C-methylase UbiE
MDRAAWDQRYRDAQWIWGLTPNRFVAEELDARPPGRALDLACGEGRNALWLARQGWRVTAVDFSEVALEKGRKRAASDGALDIEWVVADVTGYEPAARGFDLALVAYLHLSPADLDVVLRRAAGALAPGGMALVVGHDVTNVAEGVGGPQDPWILYTPEAVAASLESLRIEKAGRVRRIVEGETELAIDTLVVGVRD